MFRCDTNCNLLRQRSSDCVRSRSMQLTAWEQPFIVGLSSPIAEIFKKFVLLYSGSKALASTQTETSNLISCLTVHKIHKYSFSKSRMFMQSAFCQAQISLCEASSPEGNSSYRSRTPACHYDLSSTSFLHCPFLGLLQFYTYQGFASQDLTGFYSARSSHLARRVLSVRFRMIVLLSGLGRDVSRSVGGVSLVRVIQT